VKGWTGSGERVRGMEGAEGEKVWKRGGRARLRYLSSPPPRVPSYATAPSQ